MEKFLTKALKHTWIVVLTVTAITVFFFVKMITNSRMETNLDKYMPQDHPAFVYSDKAEKWFDIKDGIQLYHPFQDQKADQRITKDEGNQ